MANTFKVVTFAAEPASAGTPYKMYTVAGSTTTVVLGLILTNIHTTAVTVEVELVSDTANRAVANNTANGTAFLVKDVSIPAGSTTTVVLGLILANIHTTAVTTEVELVSTTANRGGANNVANGTSMLVKDVSIPSGSSLEILSGSKVILEAGDKIQIDCSVADKLSGTLSVMEIT